MNIKMTVEVDGNKIVTQESYVSSEELKSTRYTPRYLSSLYVHKQLDALDEYFKEELEAKIVEVRNK